MADQQVAVVGAGNWGKNIIRVCHELGVLACICDHDAHKTAYFNALYGVDNVDNKEWEQILSDVRITAVAIVVPARLHPKFIKEALLANKHVFVEKPLAHSYAVAKELCQLAQDRKRVLMVGHILQYHNAYIKLKELVLADQIGDIKYIESTRLHLGPVRYHDGIIWELLPHDISMVLGIIGKDNDVIADMTSMTSVTIENHNFAISKDDRDDRDNRNNKIDLLEVNMKFHNGIKARVYTSWLYPKKEQKLTVIGTKGALIFEDTIFWEQKLKLCQYDTATTVDIDLVKAEPLKAEIAHFIHCANNNASPLTNGDEATKVVRLLEQIETNLIKKIAATYAYEQN